MKPKQTSAQVERISPLTDSIMEVVLKPDHYIDYIAGQYLQIQLEKECLSFSIANAPLGSQSYELQIRHNKNNALNEALFAEMKQKGRLELSLPFGDCHFNHLDLEIPILFIAGGTGFAPVKAMIEQLLANADPRPFELYWGARSQSDLYMDDKLRLWAAHVPHFTYGSQLAENVGQDTVLSKLIAHHQAALQRFQFVICGPFDKAFAIRETLLDLGIAVSRMHSDAFSFLPSQKE